MSAYIEHLDKRFNFSDHYTKRLQFVGRYGQQAKAYHEICTWLTEAFGPGCDAKTAGYILETPKWAYYRDREDTFYKGWGLRPDTWPVGPVDLRWDHRRKVWTAAPEVMFAEVQLEDDLSPPTIARGFLNYADEQAPLPNNLKRMVLVKDF